MPQPINLLRPYDPTPRFLHTIGHERALRTSGNGALIVYCNETLNRQSVHITGAGLSTFFRWGEVVRWRIKGREFYAAVFRNLAPSDYKVWWQGGELESPVTVRMGMVCQLDWRETAWIGPGHRSKHDNVLPGRPYMRSVEDGHRRAAGQTQQTSATEQEAG